MTTHLTTDRTAVVEDDIEWRPMSSCPRGTKVQVLGLGGVGTTTVWDGKDPFWVGWYPYPRIPAWMRDLMK